MPKKKYQILLLIEMLEHIGLNWKSMYTNKILFLRKIRKLIERGFIQKNIAKIFNVTQETVSCIKCSESRGWRFIALWYKY
ncbi:hypothetical protein LCGC14_2846560 [marine sediment metagenome]|uniref:Uncharacterized protein n=1 Tax=marine sediment metagenome TaxID=412755 RepID=A0A0F9B0P5_9ZZZZ